jgi:hypothetical protein
LFADCRIWLLRCECWATTVDNLWRFAQGRAEKAQFVSAIRRTSYGRTLRLFLMRAAVLALAFGFYQFGAAFWRSSSAFTNFQRVELCSICGAEKLFREIRLLDGYVIQSAWTNKTAVAQSLCPHRQQACGHCWYSVHEQMLRLSMRSATHWTRNERGRNYGADVVSNPKYVAAIQAFASENPEAARLVWSRTVRHCFNENTNVLQQIRIVLSECESEQTKQFLSTNRYFRPARPNPEALFALYRL